MEWFLSALGLVVHVYFWGCALAVLILPRQLERFWPALAPFAGLCLQSSVVYFAGFFERVPGTDAYAFPSLAIPAGLAGFVAWRRGWSCAGVLGRAFVSFWPIVLVQVAVLLLLVAPLARSGLPLTSVSLGSCDAADYAAGARVLQEIAPGDRTGFLGQEEVIQIGTTRDFHAHWVRLNHFTPAACMAMNASVLRVRPHEIVTLFGAVLPVLLIPVVFFAGRLLFRFPRSGALVLAGAMGASPLLAYAVYQAAPAQILATMGATVLTCAAVRAFETARSWRGLLRWSGVSIAAIWLLAGSYNFILPFVFLPAIAWVAIRSARQPRLSHACRWLAWSVGCLGVAAVLFFERFAGLAERYASFEVNDFGWKIPGLRPEGWLGAVEAPTLAPATNGLFWAGLVLLAGSVAAFAWRRGPRNGSVAVFIAFAGPPICGWAVLMFEAARQGNNASYDAYKLICVFLPLVVGAMCPWLGLLRAPSASVRCVCGALSLLLLAVNFGASLRFHPVIIRPPLVVDRDLVALSAIENIERVDGMNMRIDRFWDRLWANGFLLKKRQYFRTHTYEGRRPAPLDADFDLCDSLLRLADAAGRQPVFECADYTLLDRRAPSFLELAFGPGWFEQERYEEDKWRWSESRPVIHVLRLEASDAHARITLDLRAAGSRDLVVLIRGNEVWRGRVGEERQTLTIEGVVFPTGASEIVFESPQPATPAPAGDPRRLLVALFGCSIDILDTGENSVIALAAP